MWANSGMLIKNCVSTLSMPIISPKVFFECYCDHRDLHSFPTRRSSDLVTFQQGSTALGCPYTSRMSAARDGGDRKSTRLNSSHVAISYAVFCLKKKTLNRLQRTAKNNEISQVLFATSAISFAALCLKAA